MDVIHINTKIQIPTQSSRVVPRARLTDILEENLGDCKLALVSAPAGYGKTTALAQWAYTSRYPVAWLSIDEQDNDLERFLRYLFAGWERVQPEIRESPLSILLSAMAPDIETVLAEFINVASAAPGPIVFVLDDYHLIQDESIHQALSFLLDHLPAELSFVLASRAEPPLPVARYRARGELLELRAGNLRFLIDETRDFLANMGLELASEAIDSLQSQTEGWIVGLQLASLSLRQNLTDAQDLVVSGRQRFIADYLQEDVLAHLPADARRFLLQTSILDRLYGPLCDTVTGTANGQEMLEYLESQNLFLVPLDDARRWFRYHSLFAAYLGAELARRSPGELAGLHQRAGSWYLAHDMPEQAFRHAIVGQDVELVIRIFEHYAQARLMGGEFKPLEGWLEALPETWLEEYPLFGLVQAGLLLFTGQLEACVKHVDHVERRIRYLEREDTLLQLAQVKAIRCSIACFQNDLQEAVDLAQRAFRVLPEEDRFFRAIIDGSLGDVYRRNGRWQEAKGCYLRLLDFMNEPSFRLQSAHVFGALADLELRQGNLQAAAGYWRRALEAARDTKNWGHLPLPLIGWMHIRMGELLYEWNELEQAREHLLRGLERAEIGGDVRAMIAGYLIAGRLALTEGETTAAQDYLERARPLVAQAQFAGWTSSFERLQLELWLAQDRLGTAVDWADDKLQEGELQDSPESQVATLAIARVLIIKGYGPSIDRAMASLESLLQTAQAEGRIGIAIEALALQALAWDKLGQRPNALISLERALGLAEPEGYVRSLVDLGLPMGRLLQEAHARQLRRAYVDKLLKALEGGLISKTAHKLRLPEPLTDREQEVLGLLAAGLTNREIAERLVISSETVKKHAGNIYRKLGVNSRSQAAASARELNLLD